MKSLDKSVETQVENTLKALERAKRRKSELKTLLEVLQKEYTLIKKEIGIYEEQIEKWMSDKEYSSFLDTIKLNNSAAHKGNEHAEKALRDLGIDLKE